MSNCSENHIDTKEEKEEQHRLWNEMHTKDCIQYLEKNGYIVYEKKKEKNKDMHDNRDKKKIQRLLRT